MTDSEFHPNIFAKLHTLFVLLIGVTATVALMQLFPDNIWSKIIILSIIVPVLCVDMVVSGMAVHNEFNRQEEEDG